MQLGIFAKTFSRDSVAANLDAVAKFGFEATQYNLVCAGLPTLPGEISRELCDEIGDAHRQRGLIMAAISATFNIIDPNVPQRQENLRRLEVLAQAAPAMGTNVLTLCTGTCDPQDMWKPHPNNASAGTWRELVKSMRFIAAIAEKHRVIVAIEPELSNVVQSALRARRLLDEIGSPCVKIVLDGANLIDSPDQSRMEDVLDEALELLGPDIVLAHAKDCDWQDGPRHRPAGTGIMNYDYYLKRLSRCGFNGPLVLHGLEENEVPACSKFLRSKLAALNSTADSTLQSTRTE